MTYPARVLSREQVRRVDEIAINEWGFSGLVLMENAGRGVADVLCELGVSGKVTIVCARGNNAGDGFVLARHLRIRGYEVVVVMCADAGRLTGDAAHMFARLNHCGVTIHGLETLESSATTRLFESSDWLVDALLGTGATGAPREPYAHVIRLMNAAVAKRFAIDLPSGLDADTGACSDPTFRADHTCTLAAIKPGLLVPEASSFIGEVHCVDIGLPWRLVEKFAFTASQDNDHSPSS